MNINGKLRNKGIGIRKYESGIVIKLWWLILIRKRPWTCNIGKKVQVLQHGPDENNTKTRGERIARVSSPIICCTYKDGGIDGGRENRRGEKWGMDTQLFVCALSFVNANCCGQRWVCALWQEQQQSLSLGEISTGPQPTEAARNGVEDARQGWS